MPKTIDWPPQRQPRRRGRLVLFVVIAVLLVSGAAALSYYVDALWYGSLGYVDVFWTSLNLQAQVFSAFTLATFVVLYGSFLILKPGRLGDLSAIPILINGQPLKLPVEPVLRLVAIGGSLFIAAATGAAMMADWTTLALYWHAPAAGAVRDPIFGRPLTFYLFTLPAWQLVSGWLLTLAVIVGAVAVFFVVIGGGQQLLSKRQGEPGQGSWRGL